jgi:hypothetical protein
VENKQIFKSIEHFIGYVLNAMKIIADLNEIGGTEYILVFENKF